MPLAAPSVTTFVGRARAGLPFGIPDTAFPRGLLPGLLAATATGAAVWWLWSRCSLPLLGGDGDAPFRGAWRWMFALAYPAVFPAFTALHAYLVRQVDATDVAPEPLRWAVRVDRWSYPLLFLLPALILLWPLLPDWRLAFGSAYVLVLFAKTGLAAATLCAAVFRSHAGARLEAAPSAVASGLALLAFLVYAFLAPYVALAVSTGGDEPLYLLHAESLRAGGDFDIRDDLDRGAHRAFYWGPGAPDPARGRFVGFPLLVLPGYALGATLLPAHPLGGRLGALLTIAACAAVLVTQSYRLTRDIGASREAALLTALGLAFGPPLLVHANHAYPEIPAALGAVLAVRAILRLPDRGWWGLIGIAALALAMLALKDRYTPLALALAGWGIVRLARRHPGTSALALAALALAGVVVAVRDPLPGVFPNLRTLPPFAGPFVLGRAALGLIADQEFGLLAWAPHWTLAAVGMPWLWRRRREVAVGLAAVSSLYLGAVIAYRWTRWYGGSTPAGRFLLPVLPLLAPFAAAALDHARGRLLAAVGTLALAWGLTLAVLLALRPAWRYDPPDGQARWLHALGGALGLDLARFLPSLVVPSGWTWVALLLGSIAAITWARVAGRREMPAPGWGPGATVLAARPAAALIGGLVAIWVLAAATVPTWSVAAAAMARTGGTPVERREDVTPVWLMREDGELMTRVVGWPALTEVAIEAGAYTTSGGAPRLSVTLGGVAVDAGALRAGAGGWVSGRYVVHLPGGWGARPLRLQVSGLVDEPGRYTHLYVERVTLHPARGSGPPADCRTEPATHCPQAPVTRAELAVALLRARHGQGFTPPPARGAFGDVPDGAAAWIEAAVDGGLFQACGPAAFCPDTAVRRADLAGPLLRAVHGPAFRPPPASDLFTDVPASEPAAPWIETMGRALLTCGCGQRRFCPQETLSWGQLAAILSRAFAGSYPASPCRPRPVLSE